MRKHGWHLAMTLFLLVFAATGAAGTARAEEGGDTAPDAASRAEALLDEGRVEEAARAFADAAARRPDDAALRQRALLLRRVVTLERFVANRRESPQWTASAIALHAFYLAEDLPGRGLDLARALHEREDSARTSVILAETYLALDRSQDAAVLLAARPEPTAHETTLNGIALARLGHKDDARGLTDRVVLDGDASPVLLAAAARLRALTGRGEEAIALLRRSFEKTPAAALAAARARAKKSPDFAVLRETEAFAKILKTASKVADTCSGGSSCATCPNRGGCGGR